MGDAAVRPSRIITINADASIKAAAEMMHKNGVGCLIVTDGQRSYVGLITERDIVSKVVAGHRDSETTALADVMTKQFITVSPDTAPETVRRLMTENRIRHIPIIDNGVIVGMHSIRDVVARQLLQDRMAAEEIARLSTCLKSIDINELTDVVTTEVPKLFGAQRCVLYFQDEDDSCDMPAIYEQKNCPCAPQCLNKVSTVRRAAAGRGFCFEDVPSTCRRRGIQDRHLGIWLDFSDAGQEADRAGEKLAGCLCMCGLSPSVASNYDQLAYKANLCREVLNSHLTNARLYEQAKITSLTDTLTGVGSRRFLEDRLQTESERAIRYDRPMSVAIMDIDNFKSINDLMGHSVGDETLRKLADCVRTEKRTTDILARYGGDEFVLLMPETGALDAVNLVERLREKVTHIKISDGASTTISCGIAESSPDMEGSTGEIVRRADRALYDAKAAGRNCVRIWSEASGAADENEIELEKIKRLQRRIAGLSEKSEKMFIQSIWGLVQALEAKDAYTRRHSENVMRYCAAIAETMAIGPKQAEMLRHAAMIHDIGKIGIPDAVLDKPGKLTEEERLIVEQHPVIAVQILDKMSFLDQEIAVIRHHHEKWNGQGYPDGLAGEQIPLGARIIAVADAFDALTSNRSYHESRPVGDALGILIELSGRDFDPDVVTAMVSWVESHGSIEQLGPEQLLQIGTIAEATPELAHAAPQSM